MILHALVDDLRVARVAIEGGATLVQLRLKERSTIQRIEQGVPFRDLCARSGVTFVVNDDVEAALVLGADGVHLGSEDDGLERAREAGLLIGLSAQTLELRHEGRNFCVELGELGFERLDGARSIRRRLGHDPIVVFELGHVFAKAARAVPADSEIKSR